MHNSINNQQISSSGALAELSVIGQMTTASVYFVSAGRSYSCSFTSLPSKLA